MARPPLAVSIALFVAGSVAGAALASITRAQRAVGAAAPGPAAARQTTPGALPGAVPVAAELRLDIETRWRFFEKSVNDRIKAQEARVVSLEQGFARVDALPQRVATLEGGVSVSTGGSVTLKGSVVKVQASMLEVPAGSAMSSGTIQGGSLIANSVAGKT